MPPVESLASAYIARMKQVQPEGPYLLGGWSFGGTVAFEMAAQLRAAGEQVAHLLLLDAAPPETPLGAGARALAGALWRWILRHPAAALRLPLLGPRLRDMTPFERFMMGSVFALDPFLPDKAGSRALLTFALGADADPEVLDALPSGSEALLDRWYETLRRNAVEEERARYFLPGTSGRGGLRQVRVVAQAMSQEFRYRPRRRYSGPVTLFAVKGDRATARWQRYCEDSIAIREYSIQAIGRYPAHFCMLDAENVALFATDVDAVLEASAPAASRVSEKR
jgi:thioesterase domain-containing protein